MPAAPDLTARDCREKGEVAVRRPTNGEPSAVSGAGLPSFGAPMGRRSRQDCARIRCGTGRGFRVEPGEGLALVAQPGEGSVLRRGAQRRGPGRVRGAVFSEPAGLAREEQAPEPGQGRDGGRRLAAQRLLSADVRNQPRARTHGCLGPGFERAPRTAVAASGDATAETPWVWRAHAAKRSRCSLDRL